MPQAKYTYAPYAPPDYRKQLLNSRYEVGTFSNVNVNGNLQIAEEINRGVKEAVSEVLAPYLSDIADNTKKTADKDFKTVLEGREMITWLKDWDNRMGYDMSR